MKARVEFSRTLALVMGFAVSLAPLAAQAAEQLTITFQTSAAGGRYNPKNVVAVYVQDSNAGFVKTLGRWARVEAVDLKAWITASGGDSIAVMGATRSDHSGTLTVTWDMTNKAGSVVQNGNYVIAFDLADGQEASTTFPFVKDGNARTETVNGSVFSNITMTYTGAVAGTGTTTGGTTGGGTGGTTATTSGGTTGPVGAAICGDGVMNGSDACDGTDFGPKTCKDLGFAGGSLRCTSTCQVDTTACIAAEPPDNSGNPSGGCAAASVDAWPWTMAAVALAARRRKRSTAASAPR